MVLSYAALLGYRFDSRLLGLALQRDVETLVVALQRMRDSNFIVEEGAHAGFRFRHALTRQALLGEAQTSGLPEVHGRIVAALEAWPGAERRLDRLVYHAREAGIRAKVLLYGERAGDAAAAMRAVAEAARFYAWAGGATGDEVARARLIAKARIVLGECGVEEG